MSALSIPTVVMASISFYVGLYHLLIYLRRRQHREDLTFALMCLATSLYEVCCAGLYNATSVAEGAQWQRMQFIALGFFTTAFLWFVSDYTHLKPKRAIYAFSAFYLLAILIQIVDRSSLTWMVDRPAVKEILLPFGLEITYYEVTLGPFTTLQGLMGMVAATYIVWNGVRFYQRGYRREGAPLLLALGFMYAAAINDTAVSMGLYQFVYAIEYIYLAMILLMAYSLSNTVVEAAMAKETLKKSEERLRMALEGTADGIWDWNPRTGQAYFSPRYYTMLGYEPGEFPPTYESWQQLLHPDDAKAAEKAVQHALEEHIPYAIEFRLKAKSGEWRWILSRGKIAELDMGGKAVRVAGSHTDITERKRAEEALRFTQQAVDRARDAIHWVGADGELLYVNEATCQSLGYTREELLSMTIFDIDPLYPKETWADHWEKERHLGHYKLETVHKTKDGRLFPVEIVVDRVNYGGQEYNCAYARDITERKRTDQIIQLRLRLMEFAATHSLEELLQKTLDEVGELTNSPIGFYHFVEADQKTLALQVWSTRTIAEFCQAEGQGLHYPIDQAGVWVDCVRERRAVIHNDYQSLPHRKGLPEGHAPVIRELVVPILRDERIVAILGVGNKSQDYTDTDAEIVAYVADLVWEITERKRAEEALRLTSFALERVADAVYWTDSSARILDVNEAACRMLGYTREELLQMSLPDIEPEISMKEWPGCVS